MGIREDADAASTANAERKRKRNYLNDKIAFINRIITFFYWIMIGLVVSTRFIPEGTVLHSFVLNFAATCGIILIVLHFVKVLRYRHPLDQMNKDKI